MTPEILDLGLFLCGACSLQLSPTSEPYASLIEAILSHVWTIRPSLASKPPCPRQAGSHLPYRLIRLSQLSLLDNLRISAQRNTLRLQINTIILSLHLR